MRKMYDPRDDGHRIADMSELRSSSPSLSDGIRAIVGRATSGQPASSRDFSDELQDSEERLMVILGTLKAALSIGMVYIVAFGVAIALMVACWRP